MKSKGNYFRILLFVSLFSNNCKTQEILDYNNVSVGFSAYPLNENLNGINSFYAPKGNGTHTLFYLKFNFGAKDINDTIYISTDHYFQSSGVNRIYQGPVSSDYSNASYQERWINKIWKLSKIDIDLFRAHWLCNQGLTVSGCNKLPELSETALNSILTWPGNGDTTRNESAQLAPYYDRNNNGKYEPNLGDYPIIKGMSAVYMIQNDDAGSYFQTNTNRRMGIEIHTMYYQFSALDEINNATFFDLTIFNRSDRNYNNFIIGKHIDGDIGNYSDDYFACDTSCNLMYFYNGDENDESDGGRIGYGEYPPAFGLKALNHKMNSCVRVFDNSSWYGDTSGSNIHPYTWKDRFWFHLNGLSSYGNPYFLPNGNTTKYQYYGNPVNPEEWSELSESLPVGDRKGYFTTEPVDLLSGQKLVYSYGLVYEGSGNRLQNVAELLNNCSSYQEAFDSDFEDYMEESPYNLTEETINLAVYPNPLIVGSTLNFHNPNQENLTLSIIDVAGNVAQTIRNISSQSVELNRSNLKKGIYFIELRNQQGLISKGKVIIN
jgi:hypothetical protein